MRFNRYVWNKYVVQNQIDPQAIQKEDNLLLKKKEDQILNKNDRISGQCSRSKYGRSKK